ncbi:MAG: tripartite tricarboxylate transporter substrate-binding protein [Chloroflexota bacterium]
MVKKLMAMGGVLLLALALVVVGCGQKAAPVAGPGGFYQGKTIEFSVSDAPGGDGDLVGRLLASWLGETGANVTVYNRHGAGGLDAVNHIYKAEPDGLNMGLSSTGKLVTNKILDEPAAAYEVDKLSYIMDMGSLLRYFFIKPDGPYQTVQDLQAAKGILLGGSSPAGTISLGALTIIELLGLDAKLVTGINGEGDRALAVTRGEIVGYSLNLPTARSSLDSNLVKPMFVIATQRDPAAPDVPAITELVNLNADDLALVRLWETALAGGNLWFTTGDIPADRLAYLRGLALKWSQDEGFRAQVDRLSGQKIDVYTTGDKVEAAMADIGQRSEQFKVVFADMIVKYRK